MFCNKGLFWILGFWSGWAHAAVCQATTRSGAVKVAGSFKIKGFVVPFVQPIWFGCLTISVYLMMPARSTNLIASFEMDDAIDAWASAPRAHKIHTPKISIYEYFFIITDKIVLCRGFKVSAKLKMATIQQHGCWKWQQQLKNTC